MSHHLWAAVFMGLLLLASLMALLLAGPAVALVILGSGGVPALVSWGSMVLVIDRAGRFDARRYDKQMLVNFFVKVIVIGAWTATAIAALKWPPAVFTTALLINFLAWHFLEAAMYQRQLTGINGARGKA